MSTMFETGSEHYEGLDLPGGTVDGSGEAGPEVNFSFAPEGEESDDCIGAGAGETVAAVPPVTARGLGAAAQIAETGNSAAEVPARSAEATGHRSGARNGVEIGNDASAADTLLPPVAAPTELSRATDRPEPATPRRGAEAPRAAAVPTDRHVGARRSGTSATTHAPRPATDVPDAAKTLWVPVTAAEAAEIVVRDAELAAKEAAEFAEAQSAPAAPDVNKTLGDVVRWTISPERTPVPEGYKRLSGGDRAIVRAAAALVGNNAEATSIPKGAVAASLEAGANVANLLVAAEALKPEPAEPAGLGKKAAKGVLNALAPAKLKSLTTAVGDLRADRAARSAGVTDEQLLNAAVDRVAYDTYKTHVAKSGMPTLGRTLVLGRAAELLGLQADGPEKDQIAMAIAEGFMEAYDGSANALRQIPKEPRERLNALRHLIASGRGSSEAMSSHAQVVESVRVKEAAAAAEVARQAEVKASLPAIEAQNSRDYNLLMAGAKLSELHNEVRSSYAERTAALRNLAEAEAYFRDDNADLAIAEEMSVILELSEQVIEQYDQQLADAGMALFERGMGADMAEEAFLRNAWAATHDPDIGEELAKIQASKRFDSVMPMVLAIATESAYRRREDIAQGNIRPADAILCTSFSPYAIIAGSGASPAAAERVRTFNRQLSELKHIPTRSDPKGPFIQGVLAHYGYPPQMKDKDSTGDIKVPTATKLAGRSGVLPIMQTAYVDHVLSKGTDENTPGYVILERRARLAEVARAGYNPRALPPRILGQVARAEDASRRLQAIKSDVQRKVHPRSTPLAAVRDRAEAARRRLGLPDISRRNGWN